MNSYWVADVVTQKISETAKSLKNLLLYYLTLIIIILRSYVHKLKRHINS